MPSLRWARQPVHVVLLRDVSILSGGGTGMEMSSPSFISCNNTCNYKASFECSNHNVHEGQVPPEHLSELEFEGDS